MLILSAADGADVLVGYKGPVNVMHHSYVPSIDVKWCCVRSQYPNLRAL